MKKQAVSEIVSQLKRLQRSPAWKIVCDHLDDNIKALEDNILTVNRDNNNKDYTYHDMLRSRRLHLISTKELPEMLVSLYE